MERPVWVQGASHGWTFNCPNSVLEFLYASSLSLDAEKEFERMLVSIAEPRASLVA